MADSLTPRSAHEHHSFVMRIFNAFFPFIFHFSTVIKKQRRWGSEVSTLKKLVFFLRFLQTSSFSFPSRQIMSRGKSLNNFFLCGFCTSWDFSFSFPNISSVALSFFSLICISKEKQRQQQVDFFWGMFGIFYSGENLWHQFGFHSFARCQETTTSTMNQNNCVYMRWRHSGWWRRWLPFRVRQGRPPARVKLFLVVLFLLWATWRNMKSARGKVITPRRWKAELWINKIVKLARGEHINQFIAQYFILTNWYS